MMAGCAGTTRRDATDTQAKPRQPALSIAPNSVGPVDQILIAQAMVEDIALVTTDSGICRYAGEGLRVVN